MLLSFTVSNFRSFDKEEKLSMEAGRFRNFSNRITRTTGSRVLKFKAIFGSNASGKSNLVKALRFMRHLIIEPRALSRTYNYYCRTNPQNIDKPSKFIVELILNNKVYEYGFEVLLNEGQFVSEWLVEKKGTHSVTLIQLSMANHTFKDFSYIHNPSLKERLCIYAEDVSHDGSTLFLHVINQNKAILYHENPYMEILKQLYRWFANRLIINMPDEPITQYGYFMDAEISKEAATWLRHFDTGITNLEFCDELIEKVEASLPKGLFEQIVDELYKVNRQEGAAQRSGVMLRTNEGRSMYLFGLENNEVYCKTLKFNHASMSDLFSLAEESDGTVRLLDLLEVLLSKSHGSVYVIDEFSRCLHPLLTTNFVAEFLKLAEERDIQLIITTHEAQLLNLKLIRQDELCFVERQPQSGSSMIFNLEGVRFDTRIRNAYLRGELHGVPRI